MAAGQFKDASGYDQAMTETSTDGGVNWSLAQPATFAPNLQNSSPNAFFNSVSCSGSSCVAAGQFKDASGRYQAMTESSSDGGVTWGLAQPAIFAPNVQNSSPHAAFYSVSCSSSTCVAAGQFADRSGHEQAMTETSTDGGVTWGLAQPATYAPNLQSTLPYAFFDSVSCSVSSCVAAGRFADGSGHDQAMTETSTDGGVNWGLAQPVTFAPNLQNSSPFTAFYSVSCSGSSCVAAGQFVDRSGRYQAMTETSTDGGVHWGLAQPATFAPNLQNTLPNTYFDSVSCSASSCVAAGRFYDGSGRYQAMTETSTNGGVTWSVAQPATYAPNLQSTLPYAFFDSVSCSSSSCVAAGQFSDGSGHDQAMTETSTDGGVNWSLAQPATFAPNVQNSSPNAFFNSVSCSGSSCVAAGQFYDVNGHRQAMTETSLMVPSVITNLQLVRTASGINASWTPVGTAVSYTCTLLYGFNQPSTFTVRSASPSCSFYGLSATTSYGVAVVANSAGSSSPAVSAFITASPTTTTTVHAAPKRTPRTIVCVRGTRVKHIRGLNPVCPTGYKRR